MIEMVYRGTSKDGKGKERTGLPKNIRQIGDAGSDKRVYIEDCVITFLEKTGCAVLLGEVWQNENMKCLFADGAVEIAEIARIPRLVDNIDDLLAKQNPIISQGSRCFSPPVARERPVPTPKLLLYCGVDGNGSNLFPVTIRSKNLPTLNGQGIIEVHPFTVWFSSKGKIKAVLISNPRSPFQSLKKDARQLISIFTTNKLNSIGILCNPLKEIFPNLRTHVLGEKPAQLHIRPHSARVVRTLTI